MRECIFYKKTHRGKRCILMTPEDWWRIVKYKGIPQECHNTGKGCRTLLKTLKKQKQRHLHTKTTPYTPTQKNQE